MEPISLAPPIAAVPLRRLGFHTLRRGAYTGMKADAFHRYTY